MSVVALIFFVVVGGALYFLPTIVARNGDRAGPVFVLNLFLGWTLIGWMAAFAIAATSKEIQPMKTCPACAEAVLAAAKVCRHCGHALEAPSPAVDPNSLPTVDEIAYGHELNRAAKPAITADESMPMSWRHVVALILLIVIAGGIGLKIWQDQHPQGVVWQQPAAAAVSVTRPLVVVPEPDAAAVGILLDGWARSHAPLAPLN